MADEQHVVRAVSWTEVFCFPNIFKSFKMAIHPSKLMLALLAIALTVVLGFVMDWIWAGASSGNRVMPDETWKSWTSPTRTAFLAGKDEWLDTTRVESLVTELRMLDDYKVAGAEKLARDDFDEGVGKVEADQKARLGAARKTWEEAKGNADETVRAEALKTWRGKVSQYVTDKGRLEKLQGKGIFSSFLAWELGCVDEAIRSVRQGRLSAGLDDLYDCRGKTAIVKPQDTSGLLGSLVMMGWGLWWLASTYKWYALIYVAVSLAVWSLCGGAVCRMAALHAAREERITMVAALKFAVSKFVSFFAAPLVPLALIVALGLLIALGGLAGAVPYIGEWFVAVLLILALVLGAVIAFVSIGLVAGAPLMWPTIATEGSDSFDAISRSFLYVFNRPFSYGFYWLVAAVHGTICYLFVRLFAFLTLCGTHHFAGWAMKLAPREGLADGAGKLDAMWGTPSFYSFHGGLNSHVAESGSETAASYVLAVWVYLVAGIVLAFLVCYFFSAATNIYLILRRKVDATDLDDVYVEESEEEGLEEPAPAPPAEPKAPQQGGGEEQGKAEQ